MFDILHEDNHIIVVKKPFNVPVMADNSRDNDMLTIIKGYLKEKYNKQGNVYLGLVHRLDRPTGGVMVFAKTSKAAERLSKDIREREFEKRYYAVLSARPRELKGTLTNYLKKDTKTNIVSIVPKSVEGAKYAELSYKIIDYNDNLSLADIDLATGRSHQIRVQFKNIKTPILGDIRYGIDHNAVNQDSRYKKIDLDFSITNNPPLAEAVQDGSEKQAFLRDKTVSKPAHMALWAYHLRFCHPTTKTIMVFRAAPPFEEYPWSEFSSLEATFNNIISGEIRPV